MLQFHQNQPLQAACLWLAAGLTGLVGFARPAFADDPHQTRHQQAIASAEQVLEQKADASAHSRAGDAYLRAGNVKQAIRHFDEAVRLRPESEPYLWQRGIAFYFAGRYEQGKEQFESHRRVNPNDVENAAWHFVCAAKASNFEEAKKILLPAPGDPRPPMKEILAYLRDGDAESIEAAVESLSDSPNARQSARFYADLYLGLVADAKGQNEEALRFMRRAAATPMTHYMADVARVYVDYLESPPGAKEKVR